MKGQTAIEYLMTYGWAILIILIVAGVLAYYGIFAPSGFLGPTARGFGQVQVLNPWSVVSSTGTLTINLENRVGGTINIREVDVDIGDGIGKPYNYSVGTSYAGVNVTSGAHQVVTSAPSSPGWSSSGKSSGTAYTATVTIRYIYPVGSSTIFSSTGTLSGTYS